MKKLVPLIAFGFLLMGIETPLFSSFIPQAPQRSASLKNDFLSRPDFRVKYTTVRHYQTIPIGRWLLDHPKTFLGAAALTAAGITSLYYWLWYKNINQEETLADRLESYTTTQLGVNANQCTGFDKANAYSSLWKESTDFISWLLNRRQNIENQALCTLIDEDLATDNKITIEQQNRHWDVHIDGETIVFESRQFPLTFDKKLKNFLGFDAPQYLGTNSPYTMTTESRLATYKKLKEVFAAWAKNTDLLQSKIQRITINKSLDQTISREQLYKISHESISGSKKHANTSHLTTVNTIQVNGNINLTVTPAAQVYCIDKNAINNITEISSINYQKGDGYTLMGALGAGYSLDLVSWIIANFFNFGKTTHLPTQNS